VQNFPQKERTEKELEDLHRVQNIRNFEKAACTVSKTAGLSLDTANRSTCEELEAIKPCVYRFE